MTLSSSRHSVAETRSAFWRSPPLHSVPRCAISRNWIESAVLQFDLREPGGVTLRLGEAGRLMEAAIAAPIVLVHNLRMPLLDHFRPPLSQRRHWDSFHGAWAEAIAKHLNQLLLPEGFVAEARVKLGGQVEIDVGTFAEGGPLSASGPGTAVWAPPKPTATALLDFEAPDMFEVQVLHEEGGPRLVAAIELVSPANKDRPSHRRMFAVKCASYLQSGVSVMVVDVVTERAGNLHAELLQLLQAPVATPGRGNHDLYAAAYRTIAGSEGLTLEAWAETLNLRQTLPTLPLWIMPDVGLPIDLEMTYQAACTARRIAF